jgi:hypothetical protein
VPDSVETAQASERLVPTGAGLVHHPSLALRASFGWLTAVVNLVHRSCAASKVENAALGGSDLIAVAFRAFQICSTDSVGSRR